MAELYDEESLLSGDSNAKLVEIVPEMLDYEFVAGCKSADEMRAVLKALVEGKYGRYPDLENAARAKLVDLLPDKKKKTIATLTSKPSVADVNAQREILQDWLCDVSQSAKPSGSSPGGTMKSTTTPVRAVIHADLDRSTQSVDNINIIASKPNNEGKKPQVFRKEKLSTKEYFDRWSKYDVDAALESSDDEAEKECDGKDQSEVKGEVARELEQLKESVGGLTRAERNEYFQLGDNDKADTCYSKSFILDEHSAKAHANRAAVAIRQSNFDQAIGDCTKALEIDPTFVKALARRGMCYHKAERYEEAIVDFETCHELESDAGYDRLMQRSRDKAEDRSKRFHSMVIQEVDGDSYDRVEESEYDCIEEVYTPGVLGSDDVRTGIKKRQQKQESKQSKGSSTFSTNLKTHSSTVSPVGSGDSESVTVDSPSASKTWHKITIVETSDSDEDTVEEATASMRRIDIVEEEEDQNSAASQKTISSSQRNDSDKLKAEGNESMQHQRYEDAVKFYSLAWEVDSTNTAALNNRSIAYIKLGLWEKSIVDASSCLKIEHDNTKALYRRGYAKMMLSQKELNVKEALDDFQLALSFAPPKNQSVVFVKKIEECQRILSSKKASHDTNCKDQRKKKLRSHDTQALAF